MMAKMSAGEWIKIVVIIGTCYTGIIGSHYRQENSINQYNLRLSQVEQRLAEEVTRSKMFDQVEDSRGRQMEVALARIETQMGQLTARVAELITELREARDGQ